jgi:sugar diacid utilization regulator/predicted hydrocarbon binding protein
MHKTLRHGELTMMPNKSNMNVFIQKEEDTGRIFVDQARKVMLGSHALGLLRKELIQSVGMERARTILLKFGRAEGIEMSRTFKKLLGFKSPKEFSHAGPFIHRLTGMSMSKITQLSYNHKTGEYYGEGHFHYSYEAEEHIKYFGISNEPVCHTIVGFIGGYASESYGKDIIVREIKCIGKGDAYCHYIAQPASEWDQDKWHNELSQEDDSPIDHTLLAIEMQKNVLSDILNLNEKMTQHLIKGNSLNDILETLGKKLNLAVLLEDKYFQLIDSYGLAENHELSKIINFRLPDMIMQQLKNEEEPVHFSMSNTHGWMHERLICPVYTKNGIFGYISLLKESGTFTELEKLALQVTSRICAIRLQQDLLAAEEEERLRGQLIGDLLRENVDEKDLANRSLLLGYDLSIPHHVVVLKITKQTASSAQDYLYLNKVKKSLQDILKMHVQSYDPKADWLMATLQEEIILLVPQNILDAMEASVKKLMQMAFKQLMLHIPKLELQVGIGSICHQLPQYRKSYDEAKKAINLSKNKKGGATIVSIEDFSSFSKLFGLEDPSELENIANRKLLQLRNYDESHKSELLKTLHHYFENQGNLQKTAMNLQLSIGATRYRLDRIQEICNIDLSNSRDYYETYLAMQIYLYLGIFEA